MLWARSGSLGLRNYPALWAGDQGATWSQLRTIIPAGLSTGISGMPYWGHDIGGYFGSCTPELYVRWAQLGTLSPLMQYHGIEAREPWTFGPVADEAYAMLARLRMNLVPTLMALGDDAAETGLPIMRPVWMHFPDDDRFRGDDSQFLLGEDLLVAPVMEEGATGRVVRFPEGTWHHALAPIAFDGPADVAVPVGMVDAPLFVRGGTELAVQLDEGQALGTWSPDAATRTLAFDDGRAVVRNLEAPLVGNPLGRETRLRFGLVGGVDAPTVTWFWRDQPDDVRDADVSADGRVVTADLSPTGDEPVVGRRQVYRIVNASAGLDFEGEIDWHSPVTADNAS